MSSYNAVKEILGKTIKGVIVKRNVQGNQPGMAVHLLFTDGTAYELYGDSINCAKGLNRWGREAARAYLSPPMQNVLDVSLDEE
jgi:hypothetical protein